MWDVSQTLDHGQAGQVIGGARVQSRQAKALDGSGLAARASTSSMTDEHELKAVRLNHHGIQIPDPTPENIEALALRGWMTYAAAMRDYVGHDMPTWDELPDRLKDVWHRVARDQHAVITLLGGGTIETIDAE